MKKKIILALSMIAVLSCLFALAAFAVEVDGIYYTVSITGENAVATVSTENRTSCTLETVEIPATIEVDGVVYRVTAIASNAFGQVNGDVNGYIKHLLIGENVASVGDHAFRRVATLETVKIQNTSADSLISFGNAQFLECKALISVEASKDARVKEYGNYCFRSCSSLVTVDYPDSLTRIGADCFRDCVSLTSGDLSNTSVKEIGAWGFGSCKSITEFKFPSTLTSIGNNVFLYCPVETYVFPHGMKSWGGDTLAHQSKIKVLIMPALDETNGLSSGFLYSTRPNVIIYSGDNVDYFKSLSGAFSAYDVQPIESYVPGTTYAKNTIFYGSGYTCSMCNGILGETSFKYKDLITEMKVSKACTHCDDEDVKELFNPVFKVLGYSKSNINGVCAMTQGFKIDEKSLNKYNEMFPDAKLCEFGVIASSYANVSSGVAFDENDAPLPGVLSSAIGKSTDGVLTYMHSYFEIKISGFDENATREDGTSYLDALLSISAYAVIGDTVVYFSAPGYYGETVGDPISYNTIIE